MKKAWFLVAALFLSSVTAFAGMSHKTFKDSPDKVFAAAIRIVQQQGNGIIIDDKRQMISFTLGSTLSGVDQVTVFVSGLPEGCGKDQPCSSTEVKVRASMVGNGSIGFRSSHGDATGFLNQLYAALYQPPPANSPRKP